MIVYSIRHALSSFAAVHKDRYLGSSRDQVHMSTKKVRLHTSCITYQTSRDRSKKRKIIKLFPRLPSTQLMSALHPPFVCLRGALAARDRNDADVAPDVSCKFSVHLDPAIPSDDHNPTPSTFQAVVQYPRTSALTRTYLQGRMAETSAPDAG